MSGRDLALQDALERVDGPQGQDRVDWCFAWLASWWLSKRDTSTVQALYADLIETLQAASNLDVEIIEDDPELSEAKRQQLQEQLFAMFPRDGPKGA